MYSEGTSGNKRVSAMMKEKQEEHRTRQTL